MGIPSQKVSHAYSEVSPLNSMKLLPRITSFVSILMNAYSEVSPLYSMGLPLKKMCIGSNLMPAYSEVSPIVVYGACSQESDVGRMVSFLQVPGVA